MILVDTSIWIDHLRSGDPQLIAHLQSGEVLIHPFVIGELSLGNLRQRQEILGALQDLPKATKATDIEVLGFIEQAELFGLGIGFVDAHLLASAKLSANTQLWTRDKRLFNAAVRLNLAKQELH